MTTGRFKLSRMVLASAALVLTIGAQAQTSSSSGSTGMMGGFSMYTPGTGYVGLNVGRSHFSLGNGLGGFPSDNNDTAYSLYAGSTFNNNFGLEFGYNDFGRIARAGGTTRAEGLNISLVGRVPLGAAFNVTGRLGSTYGRTDVSSALASGVARGKESGFGVSYGLGVEYSFSPKLSAVLQYDEHDLKYIGSGRDTIGVTSVGLKYRF